MIADFLRFAQSVLNAGALARLSKRSIVSMFCDFHSSLSVILGSLELGRQLQVWFLSSKEYSLFLCDVRSVWCKIFSKKMFQGRSQLSMAFLYPYFIKISSWGE